jgi:uncharacterized damage-inducible protein DinB
MRFPHVAAAVTLALATTPLIAQGQDEAMQAAGPEEGFRADLIQDVQQLEQKFTGLAAAMEGHYDWRPAEGIRSVSEVIGHVANGNFMFTSIAGVEAETEVPNFEELGPEEAMQGLEHSFTHAAHAIETIPDDELDSTVQMFGQEATKQQVLYLMVTHMHEHLGQMIAYARSNGVTPPWSAGGD